MTDKLDNQSRADLIEYRFEKSRQTLKEADVLAAAGMYNASVNRLYYAAYYAASALMIGNSIETVTHKGIKTMLGLKFIHAGLLENEYGRIYQSLFDGRQAGDYEDFIYYDIDNYKELRPLAEKFIDRISVLVKK